MHKTLLDLSHRETVMHALDTASIPFSEYSFTNLYLFRKIHKYHLVDRRGLLFIEGITRDNVQYGMPLFDLSTIDHSTIDTFVADFGMLFPIHERHLHIFDDTRFDYRFNPDDSDYLFTREKIATYPGRNLHKKRNLMKQFLESYSWYTLDLNIDKADHARAILDDWQKSTGKSESETDYLSCREALERIEEFRLRGTLLFVGDDPAGFLLGESVSNDTFALHFAKCNTRYKGIYQFIYNIFAKELCNECRYINFEQDLGIPELRQAKESYQPDAMAHKFRVTLK
jgi:uncharacterized protein